MTISMTSPALAIIAAMSAAGYSFRREEELALRGLLLQKEGLRGMLLEGPPGAGKTFLPETLAEATGAALVFGQCHAWTDSDELFVGVDVASAVAGDAANVRQDGLLARAARLAEQGPVVLVIDELDKAPERVEHMLLDCLQSGRVPVAPGTHLRFNVENVMVFITSNATRPHGDALMRRVRRVRMQPLPAATVEAIVLAKTGAPTSVVGIARKAAWEVAQAEGKVVSVQELVRFVDELLAVAESAADVKSVLAGWAAKTEAGAAAAQKSPFAGALWAEVAKAKGAQPAAKTKAPTALADAMARAKAA